MKIEFDNYPDGAEIGIILDTHTFILKVNGKIYDRRKYKISNFNKNNRIEFWGKSLGVAESTCHATLDIAHEKLTA